MSSVNVAELRSGLVKAKHLIREPHMWGKGTGAFRTQEGYPMCAYAACWRATGRSYPVEFNAHLMSLLPEPFNTTDVAVYNDHHATTHADIMALFDRAIARLDIQEFLSIANEAEKPLVNLTDALNLCWLAYGVEE